MLPSTKILSPFFTYFSTTSASFEKLEFHATQRCHSVFSCFDPLWSFQTRLVATENDATLLPFDVVRISASFPRVPIRVTLFKLRLTVASLRVVCLTRVDNWPDPRGASHPSIADRWFLFQAPPQDDGVF